MPPIRKTEMKPTAKISGVLNSTVPRHSVATQLKIFTPVGIAIRKELIMKKTSTIVALGVVNMWCAHTSSARNAMTTVAAAIAL